MARPSSVQTGRGPAPGLRERREDLGRRLRLDADADIHDLERQSIVARAGDS
jgi:hypothetical protein